MKKGLIAFAINFGCVVIAAALNMLGLPIIPEAVEVSVPLMLATHILGWLYLWFSKANTEAGLVALMVELLVRFFMGVMTVSVLHIVGWVAIFGQLDLRERRRYRCDLRTEGEPCKFCAAQIAKENATKGEGDGDIL